MKDADIDKSLLKACGKYYMKVARIMCDVLEDLGHKITDENAQIVEIRIRALVDEGKLKAVGDLSKWRHSEIKLSKKTDSKDAE